MDLVWALEEARVCFSVLRAERNDDSAWEALMTKTSSIAEVYNIALSIPRTMERQQHCKRYLYFLFLDVLNNEIDGQLVKPLPGFQAQLLIPGEKTLIMLCHSSM